MPQNPLQPGEHTGFQAVEPTRTDWRAGGETGVLDVVRVPSGDWRPYLSAGQWQRFFLNNGGNLETDACVSFSETDDIEAFMNFMVATNGYTADDIAWLKVNGYFDATGKISLSRRFLAKMSNTTTDGNNLPNVAQTARTAGMIPLANWDAPLAQLEALNPADANFQAEAWAIYYADPGAANIALGLEYAKRFDVQYEWIAYPAAPMNPSSFLNALKVAPLQIATAVCPPWNTDQVIAACGAGTQHATLMDFVDSNQDYDIRDHYVPFDKRFAPDYNITYAMRTVVVSKDFTPAPAAPVGFTHHFTQQLDFGATGAEVVALQNALKSDGDFPLSVQSTGYFGTVTQVSVEKFQAKYGIVSSGTPATTGYGRVGLKTMAQLNALFNK